MWTVHDVPDPFCRINKCCYAVADYCWVGLDQFLISQPQIRLEGLLHFIWVWWPMFDSEGSGQYFKFFQPRSCGSDRLLQLLTCTIISWSCALPLASKCSSPICTPDISCHCFSSLVSRILITPRTLRIPRVPQNAKWWHLCHLHSFYFLSGH